MAFFNFPFHIAKDKPAVAVEVQTNFDELRTWILDNLIQKDGSVAMEGPLVLAPGPPGSGEQTVNKAYVDAIIPIGTIWEFGGPAVVGGAPPAHWLWCDGQTYSEGSQQALFNAIKRNFTAASVPTGSFQVPDKRVRVSIGADAREAAKFGIGVTGGQRNSEVFNHQHTVPIHGHGHSISASSNSVWTDHLHDFSGGTAGEGGHSHTSDGGHGTYVFRDGAYNTRYVAPNMDRVNTGGAELALTWGPTVGGNHGHAFSGTTAGVQTNYPNAANHSHTISIAGSVSNQAAFNTTDGGGGTTTVDKNLPPYVAVNYMIYAGPA